MLKQIRTNLLVLSILFIILGLFLLVYPAESQTVLCTIISGSVAIYGIWGILHYLIRKPTGLYAQFSMVLSVVCIALGVFLFWKRSVLLGVMPIVFGLFILLDGIMRLPIAVQLFKAGYNRWWTYLLLAVVSGVLGVLLITHTFQALGTMIRTLGVVLIVEGALNMFTTLYASMQIRAVQKAVESVVAPAPAQIEQDTGEPDPVPPAVLEEPAVVDVPDTEIADQSGPDLQL